MKVRVKIITNYVEQMEEDINTALGKLAADEPNLIIKDIKLNQPEDSYYATALIIYEIQ